MHGVFSAVSDDGVHFSPEPIHAEIPDGLISQNQIMTVGGEIMSIVEYLHNLPSERYKMLFTRIVRLDVIGDLYTSPDLLTWTLKDEKWGNDGEPTGGAFYNKRKNRFTILSRPFWGT